MCAAGLGNLVSDVAGVGLGGVIESFAARLGFEVPHMTRAQVRCTHALTPLLLPWAYTLSLRRSHPRVPPVPLASQSRLLVTRVSIHAGSAVGVALGCVLGLFPLLLINRDEEALHHAEHEAAVALHAAHATHGVINDDVFMALGAAQQQHQQEGQSQKQPQ